MLPMEMAIRMARRHLTLSPRTIQNRVLAKTGTKVDGRTISGSQRSKRYACGKAFAIQFEAV